MLYRAIVILVFFFFNDTATTEIYTLSLHDALPISAGSTPLRVSGTEKLEYAFFGADLAFSKGTSVGLQRILSATWQFRRSEEHTSELQSRQYLVCRLLLEKKKTKCKGEEQIPAISL